MSWRFVVVLDRFEGIVVGIAAPEGTPSKAMTESRTFTQTPYAAQCETCVQARGMSGWYKTVSDEAKPPDVSADLQFISGRGTFCDELSAKATMLSLVDKEIDNVGVVHVHAKSPDAFMIRLSAAFP